MTKKKEQKKPIDMTTEEAMNHLFPKKVVKELNRVADIPPKEAKPPELNDCEISDSLPYTE